MGSGFFGECNQASPCGVSLSGVPAEPGRAFQRFPAVPHRTSLIRLRRLPVFRSGEGDGGAGRRGFRAVFGGRGLADRGVGGAHGRGAGGGVRQGVRSGFFGDLNHASPCGVSLPGLATDSCRVFQRFLAVPHGTSLPRLRRCPALRLGVMARGGGDLGCLWASGAMLARGHGSGRSPRRGSGRGARHGVGSGFFGELKSGCSFRCFSAGPAAYLCCALGRSYALCLRHIWASRYGAALCFARRDGAGWWRVG